MKTLFGKTLASLLGLSLALCLVFALISVTLIGQIHEEIYDRALAETAGLLSSYLPDLSGSAELQRWAREAGGVSAYRITIVLADGRVAADSKADPSAMENHGDRPEIIQALAGSQAKATRKSTTLGMEQRYIALPVKDSQGRIIAAFRLSLDTPAMESRLSEFQFLLVTVIALAAALAALVAVLLSRSITRPLGLLADAAESAPAAGLRAAGASPRGRFELKDRRQLLRGSREIRILGEALDSMAGELSARAESAEAKEREVEAILEGISEAVLALDSELNLRLANKAARQLFDFSPTAGTEAFDPAASGRTVNPAVKTKPCLLEIARSPELEAVARSALETAAAAEADVKLYRQGKQRSFQVLAAAYGRQGLSQKPEGVVLVLNDLTVLRRLETVRKDFVANVSHELRTPVQLVKGFAETLSGDALEDPEKARRFAEIIGRNATRMERLIDDLLSLAKLEQQERGSLETRPELLRELIQEALASVEHAAAAKNLKLELDCPETLMAEVNGGLLVQAVFNLLDNAVKYSPHSTSVSVSTGITDGRLRIEVRDEGPGIPAAELPRLFERFYRVDKARSREQGGTGLGLAIVRHIAEVHGGRAGVESWEGEGSLFWIELPTTMVTPLDPT
ncbi:MAG: ATP-binding protein [Spirochaetia bacterium]|jgi:two-component system phosphate regulon sensor histidine kinase PhoR|nr:ATP-binding protein [Spirochaetia bacterium]